MHIQRLCTLGWCTFLKGDERKVLTVVESVIYDRKVWSLPILDCSKTGNTAVSFVSLFLSFLANPAPSRGDKEGSSCGRNGDVIGEKLVAYFACRRNPRGKAALNFHGNNTGKWKFPLLVRNLTPRRVGKSKRLAAGRPYRSSLMIIEVKPV